MSEGLMCLKCRRYIVDLAVNRDACRCAVPVPSWDGKTAAKP